MNSSAHNYTEGEVLGLIAPVLGAGNPEDVCSYVIVGVMHPDHHVAVGHTEMPSTVIARLLIDAAMKITYRAAENGEIPMQPVIDVPNTDELGQFSHVGITPREFVAIEEENTGDMDARLAAIFDRFAEAEYRRNTER